jgi:hypothetical protein
LIMAMETMEKTERTYFTADFLRKCVEATKKVMSEQYVDTYSGKALGEAIARGRKEAIKKVMEE